MTLPAKWAWVAKIEGLPALVAEALKEVGTLEGPGTSNNPKIVAWADEIASVTHTNYANWAADWYNKDSVAWCGLFAALCAVRSANGNKNRWPVNSYLSALAWASWGEPVQWKGKEGLRLNNILTGDMAVFSREGGGHVAPIIGVSVDGKYIVCVGGNQDNAVNIKAFPVSRLYAVRRPPYNIRPAGARHLRVKTTGEVSTNEA